MAQEKFSKESFLAELESEGEEEVRRRIAARRYASANNKREIAQQWLDKKAQERINELVRIAQDAKDAAAESARNIKSAHTTAALALLMAAVSVIVVMLSPWLR